MPAPLFPEDAEEVAAPRRIRRLLGKVRDSGSELHVNLQGAEQNWRTTISRIDEDQGRVLYRQLTPANWLDHPGLHSPADIHCPVLENCIAYSALLSPIAGDDSLHYLQSPIPESLLYRQLRQQYRIGLLGQRTEVRALLENGAELHGEMLNISAGGCRCLLTGSAEDLGDTRQLLQCRTRIVDLLELDFLASIRNLEESERSIALCLAFVELPQGQQRKLQRCLVQLERNTMIALAAAREA